MNLRRKSKAFPGCVEGYERFSCRDLRHGRCVECRLVTCSRTAWIDKATLRRRVPFVCSACQYAPHLRKEQEKLRRRRSERDLERVTDPLDNSRLDLGRMPEQYAGPTRATLRAFLASDQDQAVAFGITPETLNQSIRNLGLVGELYAEQRHGTTVLRRTGR